MLAFAAYCHRVSGAATGLLSLHSKLTNYATLDELGAKGIGFLTLGQRGPKVIEALAALPASAWTQARAQVTPPRHRRCARACPPGSSNGPRGAEHNPDLPDPPQRRRDPSPFGPSLRADPTGSRADDATAASTGL